MRFPDHDTTLLKKVADLTEELRHCETRLRRIYNSPMIGFIFWDTSGNIIDTNDYFLQLVGYTREDLQQGKLNWSVITPPEYSLYDHMALEQLSNAGTCEPYEKEYIKKDGTRVPVIIGSACLEGESSKGVAYVIDISQRKKMEQEIIELNKELEQRVQLRTEQLEQANRELETFSYSVSHDLKAPLRVIRSFSEMLLNDYADKLDEKGAQFLNRIVSNAQKMKILIDELLEFSRLGKQELKKRVVNLDKLVTEVVQELTHTTQHKANLITHPLGQAEGDDNLLKLVYQNLLTNAIKYSSKKETPQIEIGVQEYGKAKAYYVRDNGAGFDMTYYDKLFGVFQRLHRQDEFEGVGVGLAIVQRIILKHGGKVWANSQVNEGATFYFTLAPT